jgi:predicted hydrocarbon binding protein
MAGGAFTVEETGEETSSPSDLLRHGKAFIMRDVTFADFKKGLERVFGPGAQTVFYYIGVECGRRSCRRLTTAYGRNVSADRLLEALAGLKEEEGWGSVRINVNIPEGGRGTIHVERSFEARGYGKSEKPVCFFLKGFFEGFLGEAFGREVRVTETGCLAKGDERCTFQVE